MLYFSKLKVTISLLVLVCSIGILIMCTIGNNKFFTGIKWGLDLKGGSYLLLEPDLDIIKYDHIKQVKDDCIYVLNKFTYSNLVNENTKLSFTLSNSHDYPKIKEELLKIDNNLKFSLNNNKVIIAVVDKTYSTKIHDILSQSIEIIRRRIDEFGTNEPLIKIMGNNILVELPGVSNPEQIKSIIGTTARISFNMVDKGATFNHMPLPKGYRYVYDDTSKVKYAVSIEDILTGEHLKQASINFNDRNEPIVAFKFDNYGAKKFAKATSENIGQIMAIILDNKVISAPVINSPILGGSGVIEGKFTLNEAQDLVLLLQAGSLPVPLTIIEENTVGPTLGKDSIRAGLYSFVVGMILVFVYMILFYRKLGLIANFALLCNIILTLAILSIFKSTLTLPGIAGIVLGIGMAVDSNILVYERYNFENKYTRPAIAMSNAFTRVYQTLIDSNLTTLFAAVFLFYFGSGPIRGFAVTLIVAILASMFSIFFTTRMLVNWFYLRPLNYK